MNDYFELVSEFIEYATGSGTFEIGDFVLIKDDAPAKAKKAYKQYIRLKKLFSHGKDFPLSTGAL